MEGCDHHRSSGHQSSLSRVARGSYEPLPNVELALDVATPKDRLCKLNPINSMLTRESVSGGECREGYTYGSV